MTGNARFPVLVLALALSAPAAGTGAEREYAVKGVFLHNFAVLTDWPGKPDPFYIGVLGEDPFGEVLDTVAAKKKIGDAPIRIRRFKDIDEYKPVHMLFVANAELLQDAVAAVNGQSVLIVADAQGAARQGAMINFFIEENRVRFEINRRSAENAGLKMNSRLLSLARIVENPR